MVQSLNHFARLERITWIFETLLDVMDLSHESFPLVVWIRSFTGTKDHFGTSYASRRVTWCTNLFTWKICSNWWFGARWFGFCRDPHLWKKLLLMGYPDSKPKPSGTQSSNLSVDSWPLFVPRYADKLAATAKLWTLAQEYSTVQHLSLTSSSEFAFCWVSS